MEQFEEDKGNLVESKVKKKGGYRLTTIIILAIFGIILLIIILLFYSSYKKSKSKELPKSNSKEKVLAINGEVIKQIYTPEKAIEDCQKAFGIIAAKSYNCPVRSFVHTEHQDLTIMPAAVTEKKEDKKEEHLAVKILSIVPENRNRGLPLIPGKLLLFDEETGFLKALMDGGMITNLRTGATAGTTAKILHPKPVKNVVIFGCGAQGTYGLDSLLTSHPEIEKVTCYDYFPQASKRYIEQHIARNDGRKYIDGDMKNEKGMEETIREADVIHCATTSKEELFKGEWVKDGAHISAIGCYTLEMRELPKNLFKRKNVHLWVDEFEAMKEEAGDIMAPIKEGILKEEDIHLFGDIINKKDKGRINDDDITICKFVGVAPQDTVAATSIFNLAKEKNAGTQIDF